MLDREAIYKLIFNSVKAKSIREGLAEDKANRVANINAVTHTNGYYNLINKPAQHWSAYPID